MYTAEVEPATFDLLTPALPPGKKLPLSEHSIELGQNTTFRPLDVYCYAVETYIRIL